MLKDILFNIYTHLYWFYIYTPEFYSLIIGVLFTQLSIELESKFKGKIDSIWQTCLEI